MVHGFFLNEHFIQVKGLFYTLSLLIAVASSAGGIKGRSEGAATTNGIMKVEVKEDDHLTNGTETKSIKSVPSKSSSKTPNSISSQVFFCKLPQSTLSYFTDALRKSSCSFPCEPGWL